METVEVIPPSLVAPAMSLRWLTLMAAIHALAFEGRKVLAANDNSVEATWDFDYSVDGWARASPSEMDAEVQWQPSGTIRGTVRGSSPHLDSPPFGIFANDRHHVAMRMRSTGAATRGRLELRTGRLPGETEHSLNPWTIRGNASVVVEESSSGTVSASFAADGDLTTIWEAASGTNEWVTLDLGDTRDISAIRVQAPGGDTNPRSVSLQRGLSPSGKFTAVTNITLSNSSDAQEFHVPSSIGRYWRLYVVDVHGKNDRSRIREVELLGSGDTTMPEPLDFEVINDNRFHVYYLPLYRTFQGFLTQLRLRPGIEAAGVVGAWKKSLRPNRGDGFEIDWVRIVRAPNVKSVRGCIDAAYIWPNTPGLGTSSAVSNISANDALVNGFLVVGRTLSNPVQGAEYGTTSGCLRAGGEAITISGAAFGTADAQVYIDGSPCTNVVHTLGAEEKELTCLSPAITRTTVAAIDVTTKISVSGRDHATSGTRNTLAAGEFERWMSTVEVVSGRMPGLKHGLRYLSYQAPTPAVGKPSVSNVAARAVDVSWNPPADYWDALGVTGYQIRWRTIDDGLNRCGDENCNALNGLDREEDEVRHLVNAFQMTVGNVTTTTVRGLEPGTQHVFWVRAMSENRSDPTTEEVDLYGRREALDGVVTGLYSEVSEAVATLDEDIIFNRFNANTTVNHSMIGTTSTLGPRGQWSGEGHYGLHLVGNAHIENCNRSTSCCDEYDESSGSCGASEASSSFTCAVPLVPAFPAQAWVLGTGNTSSGVDSSSGNIPFATFSPPTIASSASLESPAIIVSHDSSGQQRHGRRVSHVCGPALRLTASHAASAGAAWYPRDMTVGEGFDTSFTFRLSSPSFRCNIMDGVYTHCRSRGADGLAFVVQGEGLTALGAGGMGLGYAGISNMLAVEFDTYFNPEMVESFENHVSVQTRGWRDLGNAHESYSLGATPNVPDLTDGEISVRVTYTPRVNPEDIWHPAFQASAHVGYFFRNGNFGQGGLADWGTGIGILSVYVKNMHEPCLIVPLNLEATLRLNHGRAFVGFTAATGRDTWQVHDVLRWSFSSLRQDVPHWASPVVNGHH